MFVFLNLVCIAALVGIDQAIKLWAVHSLQQVGSMPLIPHVIELRFVYNEGMSFSLLSGKQGFLIAATSIGLLAIAWWLFTRCRNDQLQRWAWILVLGGGIGNLIDRIAEGRVVDYLNLLFMDFAIFNFADICICVGMGLWILAVILEERRHPKGKE
ncbi:signal peptidase II [Faecalibacterium sp. An77]|uniref:signal peptidase II n=1 Tax=Faecalibacterium sp. An77 TaxID=1965655 RepID=UPI000B3A8D53|nr:signal peptidase II [Faecalibacterium sp. An77]OUN40444.1 signal peptidase II [Faecalibacterium sp. An77]